MSEQLKKPLMTLLADFFDSAGLTDSFIGKITKELLLKSIAEYVDIGRVESLKTQYDLISSKLYEKWYEQIVADLSKLQINSGQKKLLLALFAASLIAKVASYNNIGAKSNLNKDLNQRIL